MNSAITRTLAGALRTPPDYAGLFGSRHRGNYTEESDYDVFVVYRQRLHDAACAYLRTEGATGFVVRSTLNTYVSRRGREPHAVDLCIFDNPGDLLRFLRHDNKTFTPLLGCGTNWLVPPDGSGEHNLAPGAGLPLSGWSAAAGVLRLPFGWR